MCRWRSVIYKKLSINLNPYQLYALVNREHGESFLLESHEGKEKLARFSFIGFNPEKHVRAQGKVVSVEGEERDAEEPLRVLDESLPKREVEKEGFVGGAVGYFSYEYVRNLEGFAFGNGDVPEKEGSGFPDFEFGIFEDCVIYDHRERSVHYLSHGEDRSAEVLGLAKEELFLGPFESGKMKTNMEREKYEGIVGVAKERINAGEIFQVVLSRKYEVPFEGNPLKFYNYLKQTNPSPYMYFLSFGDRKVIGSSPENLVRVTVQGGPEGHNRPEPARGRKIDSYATLAGTRKRGRTPAEDEALEKELLADEKERAEHLMLVDLTRNDVGKVSRFGSVDVPELMEVHKYSHVQHIASHVVGELAEGRDCFDAFNSLFPAGTVSGAPKIRAMEIIDELEGDARGPYSGAVGYFSFNRNCDFAIAIRTLFAKRQKAYVQAGAGIVYDSVPEREYEETENKMRALLHALEVVQ